MNTVGSAVRQFLRLFKKDPESLRSRRLAPSLLAGIVLFVVIFAGLNYFISRDRNRLARTKNFSYALISLAKVNDLLVTEDIQPSSESSVFEGSYRKGLLAQGVAALSVLTTSRSLFSPLEQKDLQAILRSTALLEKGIGRDWPGLQLFAESRRMVPRITALSFAVEQERDILSRRIDRMLFFRMGLLLLSSLGGLVFLFAQWRRSQRVSRRNSFYRSLSRIDRLILSVPDPEGLLRSTCRIIIEETRIQAVLVGRYDAESRSGRWVAHDGKIVDEFIRRPLSEDPSAPGGEGVWAHTVRTRDVVVWNDTLSTLPEGSLRDFYRENRIRSSAGFPVMVGDILHGALVVQSDVPDYFDPELVFLIAFMVENLSFSLKNWESERARQETAERLASVTRLYESQAAISTLVLLKTEEEKLFSETVRILIEHNGFIAAGFYFPDDRKSLLKLGKYRITDPSGLSGRHPLSFSLDPDSPDARTATVRAFSTGTPVVENDLVTASRNAGLETRGEDYDALSFRSSGVFPIFRSGLCIGVFAAVSREKNFFTPDRSQLLSEIAKILSMTLDGIEFERIRERYASIFENVREGIVITDSNRNIIDMNPFFTQVTGYSREEVFGKNPRMLHSGRQSQDFYRTMWETIDREGHWEGEIWNRKKSGEIYCEWLSIQGLWKDGRLTNYLGIFSDITERKQSESLRAQLGRILDESPSELYTFDAESLMFVSANAGALKNLGYSEDELRQMTPLDIKPFFTRDSFETLLAPLRRGEQELLVFQTEHRRKDGSLYPAEIRLQFSRTASPPVFVAIVQDITERKRNERRIEHLAMHDALTDLPNRRAFLDRIDQTLLRSGRTGERFAVGILDLDGFKGVNDRLGHPKGDELLIQVAKRLGNLLRKTDTLARLGGDEFGLLLPDLDEGAACQDLFTKIVESLLDPFDLGNGAGDPVRISGSLGLTLCPPDQGDSTSLIAHADLALYRVKDRGRNGWEVFESEMEESLLEQYRIRTEFARALGNGELCLYYQPQVDMAEGKVVGAEALVRWNHPERGFLAPAAFIGVVETSDLILPLGRWVLETAMSQQEAWEKEGLNLHVSVNIGARHFLSDGFMESLAQILARHDRPDHLAIEIEVTETEALRDLEKARKTIDACRKLKVFVSLDDFGTGKASLTSLQQLDIKEVKIDIGFVHRMLESQKDLAIVSSLSSAARMMLIDVVAEGVETEEEGEVLLQMGCRVAQGYAIARPMPPERILEWVKEWRPFESWKQQKLEKKAGVPDDTLLMVSQSIKVFLRGLLSGLETPGAMKEEWTDPLKCVPGRWIEHSGKIRYGGTPEFDKLKRMHDKRHALAQEALSARDRNDTEALERLKSELTEVSLALQEALQDLLD